MRSRCAVLLTVLSSGFLVFAAGAPSSTLPGADYPWVQPGTAPTPVALVQPPATIATTVPVLVGSVPGSAYAWAQPGMKAISVPFAQPPASIPTS